MATTNTDGCLYPPLEACATQRTPDLPWFKLLIQALIYSLPKLVTAGTSALQSSALPLLLCTA